MNKPPKTSARARPWIRRTSRDWRSSRGSRRPAGPSSAPISDVAPSITTASRHERGDVEAVGAG